MNLIRIFIIALMTTVAMTTRCETLIFNPQLVKSAENGNMHAMIALAKFGIQNGKSCNDSLAALEWYKCIYASGAENVAPLISQLAEKLNLPDIQFQYARDGQLAMCHLYGIGTEPNPAEAVKIFEATPVNMISWYWSGRMFVDHVIYLEDWMLARILESNGKRTIDDELIARLNDQAQSGDAEVMWKFAVINGIESKESADLLIKASESKSDTANMVLLNRYLSLRPSDSAVKLYPQLTKQFSDKIFKSVSKLCKQGNVMANLLAVNFDYSPTYKATLFGPYYKYKTWGKLRDNAMDFLAGKTSGHQLFTSPQNSSSSNDQAYETGYSYETDGDMEKANRFYLNSVSSGVLRCNRGDFYYNGNGFRAACRLAFFNETGAVTGKPDLEKAFEIYFSTSALYGRHSADGHFMDELAPSAEDPIPLMYKIAECYDYGKGVDENPRKALWWYQKVFKLLSRTAANRLSPEATKFARERMAELKKEYEPEEDVLFEIE